MPGNEPTSDVLCRARGTLASAPTDPALTTSRASQPTPSLHHSRQEPPSPARLGNARSLLQDAFCHAALVMLPPRVALDRGFDPARPRAPHPFASTWPDPSSKVSRLPSRLDRASRAVPARLATALHDVRTSSIRDACDRLLPPIPSESCTHRRSATGCQILTLAGEDGTHPLAGADSPVHGAFHDAPRASGSSRRVVRRAFLPVRSPCASPSDIPVTRSTPAHPALTRMRVVGAETQPRSSSPALP